MILKKKGKKYTVHGHRQNALYFEINVRNYCLIIQYGFHHLTDRMFVFLFQIGIYKMLLEIAQELHKSFINAAFIKQFIKMILQNFLRLYQENEMTN